MLHVALAEQVGPLALDRRDVPPAERDGLARAGRGLDELRAPVRRVGDALDVAEPLELVDEVDDGRLREARAPRATARRTPRAGRGRCS